MASTARLLARSSHEDPQELEAAARAKMRAEEKEREKKEMEEKAIRAAEEEAKQKVNYGGLFRQTSLGSAEFAAAQDQTSPPLGRKGEVPSPLPQVSMKANNYKAPRVGGVFSIFDSKTKEPAKKPEPEPDNASGAPEPVTELTPPPAGADSQFLIQMLFEQLAAERQRTDRLERQVKELTVQRAAAQEKAIGQLERENARWAAIHALKQQ